MISGDLLHLITLLKVGKQSEPQSSDHVSTAKGEPVVPKSTLRHRCREQTYGHQGGEKGGGGGGMNWEIGIDIYILICIK